MPLLRWGTLEKGSARFEVDLRRLPNREDFNKNNFAYPRVSVGVTKNPYDTLGKGSIVVEFFFEKVDKQTGNPAGYAHGGNKFFIRIGGTLEDVNVELSKIGREAFKTDSDDYNLREINQE